MLLHHSWANSNCRNTVCLGGCLVLAQWTVVVSGMVFGAMYAHLTRLLSGQMRSALAETASTRETRYSCIVSSSSWRNPVFVRCNLGLRGCGCTWGLRRVGTILEGPCSWTPSVLCWPVKGKRGKPDKWLWTPQIACHPVAEWARNRSRWCTVDLTHLRLDRVLSCLTERPFSKFLTLAATWLDQIVMLLPCEYVWLVHFSCDLQPHSMWHRCCYSYFAFAHAASDAGTGSSPTENLEWYFLALIGL